jgi:hypothetical protein
MILGRPRRWGVIAMAGLARAMPARLYRRVALAPLSRAAFQLRLGAAFDSLRES